MPDMDVDGSRSDVMIRRQGRFDEFGTAEDPARRIQQPAQRLN